MIAPQIVGNFMRHDAAQLLVAQFIAETARNDDAKQLRIRS